MENIEKEIDIVELFKTLWNKRYKIIKIGLIGFVVGLVIAFSIPKMYNTTVKIAPEDSASRAMGDMGSLAGIVGINIDGASSGGITSMIYPDVVKSAPFLFKFATIEVDLAGEKMSFYQYVTEEQQHAWWRYVIGAPVQFISFVNGLFNEEEVVESNEINMFRPSFKQRKYINFLSGNISVESDKKTNILTIGVNMQDPLIAAIVADSLLSKLQLYMSEYRTTKARKDLDMKEIMLSEAKSNYYLAEDKLADGLDFNRNIKSQKAQVKINRLTNEKELAFTVYKELATQVEVDKIRVQEQTPIATIIEPAKVAVVPSSPNKMLIA